MHKLIVRITDLKNKLPDVECIIVPVELVADGFESDKIVLVEGENAIEVCQKHNLDGVVVDLSKSTRTKSEVMDLRKQLGSKILAVVVRNRRHEAMLASEGEPDLVIFKVWKDGIEKNRELVEWYSDMFLIQSAVSLEEDGIDVAGWKADCVIRKL